jgi:hypothetical protein
VRDLPCCPREGAGRFCCKHISLSTAAIKAGRHPLKVGCFGPAVAFHRPTGSLPMRPSGIWCGPHSLLLLRTATLPSPGDCQPQYETSPTAGEFPWPSIGPSRRSRSSTYQKPRIASQPLATDCPYQEGALAATPRRTRRQLSAEKAPRERARARLVFQALPQKENVRRIGNGKRRMGNGGGATTRGEGGGGGVRLHRPLRPSFFLSRRAADTAAEASCRSHASGCVWCSRLRRRQLGYGGDVGRADRYAGD